MSAEEEEHLILPVWRTRKDAMRENASNLCEGSGCAIGSLHLDWRRIDYYWVANSLNSNQPAEFKCAINYDTPLSYLLASNRLR